MARLKKKYMEDYEGALEDYAKCLEIDHKVHDPYFERAELK